MSFHIYSSEPKRFLKITVCFFNKTMLLCSHLSRIGRRKGEKKKSLISFVPHFRIHTHTHTFVDHCDNYCEICVFKNLICLKCEMSGYGIIMKEIIFHFFFCLYLLYLKKHMRLCLPEEKKDMFFF